MSINVSIISKQPPGGRCALYAGYADVLAKFLKADVTLDYSSHQDAHKQGFPSLVINEQAVQPSDGVILVPDDILTKLQDCGISVEENASLAEALEEPLNRMLDQAE